MLARTIIAMTVATFCAALGQVMIRHGVDQVVEVMGPFSVRSVGSVLSFMGRSAANPWVLIGTALNALFYVLFVIAHSWSTVTTVLSLTALEYGFATVLSIILLGEVVAPLRWAGITLIALGVILVSFSAKGIA